MRGSSPRNAEILRVEFDRTQEKLSARDSHARHVSTPRSTFIQKRIKRSIDIATSTMIRDFGRVRVYMHVRDYYYFAFHCLEIRIHQCSLPMLQQVVHATISSFKLYSAWFHLWFHAMSLNDLRMEMFPLKWQAMLVDNLNQRVQLNFMS